MHRYSSDPEVVRYLSWGPNQTEDTQRFLAAAQAAATSEPRCSFHLAVVLQKEDFLIGGVGLESRNRRNDDYELGYCFAPEVWGTGYAREAISGIVDFGFESLTARRLHARIHPENSASMRLLEGLGFQQEGVLERDYQIDGCWCDSLLYATDAEAWTHWQEDR